MVKIKKYHEYMHDIGEDVRLEREASESKGPDGKMRHLWHVYKRVDTGLELHDEHKDHPGEPDEPSIGIKSYPIHAIRKFGDHPNIKDAGGKPAPTTVKWVWMPEFIGELDAALAKVKDMTGVDVKLGE